jgi:hypothetical protein
MNTHLNTLGYTEVSEMFFQTRIELTKFELRNKWDRLKGDWTIWQKLLWRQTGTRWDNMKGSLSWTKSGGGRLYWLVLFHPKIIEWSSLFFVSSYCSYDDELIGISLGVASFRGKHRKMLSFFRRCLVTFQMTKVTIGILLVTTPLYQNPNKSMRMCFMIGHIERMRRRSRRPLLPLQIEKTKACIVLEITKKAKSNTTLIIQEKITKITDSTSSFA